MPRERHRAVFASRGVGVSPHPSARDTARAMSQENVEIVKEFTRRFEQGDRDSWREYFDPAVVWDTSASKMPAAGVYHGHDGVEEFSVILRDCRECTTAQVLPLPRGRLAIFARPI
jgi:hypothetical protein